MAVKHTTILKELRQKIYHPVYFLAGEEPYYIDMISDYIEDNVLSDTEKEFNQTILYGKEADLATVLSAAKRYPMMANYQVVIVKEAQDMKDLFPKSKKSDDNGKDLLIEYLKNPQKTTLLVFCYKYKNVDGRTRTGKAVMKDTVHLKSTKMYDDKVPEWIQSYVKDEKYTIGMKAAQMLSEFLGNDLSKTANELDKLMINISKGSEITPELIERYIGISKDYNVFELQDAIGRKDVLKANEIVAYFAANPKACPFPVALSVLYMFYNRLMSFHAIRKTSHGLSRSELASRMGMNPYFLNGIESAARLYSPQAVLKAIRVLHEYDLRSKGVGNSSANHGELLREMMYKLLHTENVELV